MAVDAIKVSDMHKVLSLCVFTFGFVLLPMSVEGRERAYSNIQADELVVFFRTTAWLDEANQEWFVPIHGWVYEPEDSVARKALFSTILKNEYDLAPNNQTNANFTRRLNLMIADNERGKRIVVTIAGHNYTLPRSGANGHFRTALRIPQVDAENFAKNSLLRYSAVTKASDARSFSGEVLLIQPAGLSIISDIDDTVKISNVTDRRSLLEHTFLLDFSAVPDMAELYTDWSQHDVTLHFVSSSPWQLYAPLDEFLKRGDFPRSSLNLKPVRFRDKTLFDLFKKGTETKPKVIEKILETYPGRRFILVGDSGEHDPEVYADLIRKHPDQILKIFIRNVSQEAAENQRFSSVFKSISTDSWQLFDDAKTLTLPKSRAQ